MNKYKVHLKSLSDTSMEAIAKTPLTIATMPAETYAILSALCISYQMNAANPEAIQAMSSAMNDFGPKIMGHIFVQVLTDQFIKPEQLDLVPFIKYVEDVPTENEPAPAAAAAEDNRNVSNTSTRARQPSTPASVPASAFANRVSAIRQDTGPEVVESPTPLQRTGGRGAARSGGTPKKGLAIFGGGGSAVTTRAGTKRPAGSEQDKSNKRGKAE